VLDKGRILDIHLENRIVIINESRYITVGITCSNSSKVLREPLIGFTRAFQDQFKHELKNGIKDSKKYEVAHALLQK
jgi:N-acetyl-anhydromuramyl-L-alanine amidase AmpD